MEAWSIKHVSRELNEEAHMAARTMIIEVFVIKTNEPMYLGRETLTNEECFLMIGMFPKGLESSKKYAFIRKANKYKLIDDILFMWGA